MSNRKYVSADVSDHNLILGEGPSLLPGTLIHLETSVIGESDWASDLPLLELSLRFHNSRRGLDYPEDEVVFVLDLTVDGYDLEKRRHQTFAEALVKQIEEIKLEYLEDEQSLDLEVTFKSGKIMAGQKSIRVLKNNPGVFKLEKE